MARKADTHIRVTEETWLDLNQLKQPGDTFDDVLQRLLDEAEGEGEPEGNPETATAQTAD